MSLAGAAKPLHAIPPAPAPRWRRRNPVVTMTRPATLDSLGPEFDPFLCASIGADRNGMPLSVMSALARMDIDPWQEAARLTALPQDAATRSLEALLASRPGAQPQPAQPSASNPSAPQPTSTQPAGIQPDGTRPDASGGATAARLIALLPRRAPVNLQPRNGPAHAGATVLGHHVQLSMVLWLVLMAVLLGMQAITASRHAPAQAGQASRPALSTTLSGATASSTVASSAPILRPPALGAPTPDTPASARTLP